MISGLIFVQYYEIFQPWRAFKVFKAALINIFMLTLNQMAVCKVKWVACDDEHTEWSLKAAVFLSLSLSDVLVSFSQMFWLNNLQRYCFVDSKRVSQT